MIYKPSTKQDNYPSSKQISDVRTMIFHCLENIIFTNLSPVIFKIIKMTVKSPEALQNQIIYIKLSPEEIGIINFIVNSLPYPDEKELINLIDKLKIINNVKIFDPYFVKIAQETERKLEKEKQFIQSETEKMAKQKSDTIHAFLYYKIFQYMSGHQEMFLNYEIPDHLTLKTIYKSIIQTDFGLISNHAKSLENLISQNPLLSSNQLTLLFAFDCDVPESIQEVINEFMCLGIRTIIITTKPNLSTLNLPENNGFVTDYAILENGDEKKQDNLFKNYLPD